MLKDIVAAEAKGGSRLYLRFEDGREGEVDVAKIVELTGAFQALTDPTFFTQVRLDSELGTVVWPNGADVDPDVLYAAVTGEPIVIQDEVISRS